MTVLTIFGLVFGVALILAGIFKPALVVHMEPVNEQYLRVSEIVVGVIFVGLAVLKLAGIY